ncbi:MAG: VanZ family protein [Treponema sp.]|nr:VanZ family protein [Treponema sp.]
MFEISYWQSAVFILLIWVLLRAFIYFRKKTFNFGREAKLLLVLLCILVITRITYFPWHHVDGHIGKLIFDFSKIFPPRTNFIPLFFLRDIYPGWQMNVIGNISMFIPLGIIWPLCFKKLDRVWKSFLAGSGYSLFIEISQLLFFERCSDIDDWILNSTGVLIGTLIYFMVKKFRRVKN